ncbi:MAG: folylpolyglutamate synthase/dihydrofolate synthase family protein [Pseudomonadota bacterium]
MTQLPQPRADQVSDLLLADLQKLHPRLIDLSLGRIERLLGKLGDPHLKLPPVIHVAGTNGKGSTCAFMAAILKAAGHRVHVYTSPHLVRFHERIALSDANGDAAPIAEDHLVDVLQRVEHINDGDDITQFEITTAAALLAFSETPADAVILEVGLGGRLDATNVIAEPAVSVITPVAMDHADRLGDTVAKIAGEKAGIIKRNAPLVVARQTAEAFTVIDQRAVALNAPTCAFGRDFDVYEQGGRLVVQSEDCVLDLPMPALTGRHQMDNAGTAAMAVRRARFGLDVSEAAFDIGMRKVVWPGRMQRIADGLITHLVGDDTEIWLDGGHNEAAGLAIAQTLADLDERAPKPVDLVVGMMAAKDVAAFLGNFSGLVRSLYAVPISSADGASLPVERIVEAAEAAGIAARPAKGIRDALYALEQLHPGQKRVMICGSLYLAGEVLEQSY